MPSTDMPSPDVHDRVRATTFARVLASADRGSARIDVATGGDNPDTIDTHANGGDITIHRSMPAPPTNDAMTALEIRIRPTATETVIGSTVLAMAVLVGVDGPAPWPAFRAAIVVVVGAGCLLAGRRVGIVGSSIAILGLGIASLVAGLGIGVNHLVNDPRSAEAIAGTLALLGGIALSTVGAGCLIGLLHRWRKLLALPVGVAIIALFVLPVTLAVFVTNAPPFAASTATPADRGLGYADVAMSTADHVRLEGRYIESTNGAAIIVLGGISGISRHEIDIAAVLARHGYGVLLLEARGQGNSGGDAMLWGWWGEIDVAAGIDFLARRSDVVDGRIGAIGMSVGGEQAIAAAGVDGRLLAVVSEGATARGARDEGDPARGIGGLLTRYVDWASRCAASLMTAADRPTPLQESLAAFDVDQRALLIAAGRSEHEVDAADVFRAAAPDRVSVWIAERASHVGALGTHPNEWERRVIAFLDAALQPS